MSYSLLGQFFREFDVPAGLKHFGAIVASAKHYRFTPDMDYPANAQAIFGPDLGASLTLPGGAVAVEDSESCVVLCDGRPGDIGLDAARVFLMVTKLPIHVLPLSGQSAAALRRQIEEMQLGGSTLQLIWGVIGQFRVLKDTPPDNMTGITVPVGWHFQSLSTGFQQTVEGDMDPMLRQLQPNVFSHILTAFEQFAVMEGKT